MSKDWQWHGCQCIQSISSKRQNKKKKGQARPWTHLFFLSRIFLYPVTHLLWYCDLQDLLLAGHPVNTVHWVYRVVKQLQTLILLLLGYSIVAAFKIQKKGVFLRNVINHITWLVTNSISDFKISRHLFTITHTPLHNQDSHHIF